MSFVFDPEPHPSLPIIGKSEAFPVHRIFCVGRNFAAHAAEMGHEVDREAPFYFTKSAHHLALAEGSVPMARGTQNYHHEIEMVVALGAGGQNIAAEKALDCAYAYGVGLDMTRRDLQQASKDKRRSWDTAKDVEASALVAPLRAVEDRGHIHSGMLALSVNGETRQSEDVRHMVWSVPEVIADLSRLYHLQPGDLIFMGTPAGVGPVQAGDVLEGSLEGVGAFRLEMV